MDSWAGALLPLLVAQLDQDQLQLRCLSLAVHLLVVVTQEGEGHVAAQVGYTQLTLLLGSPLQQTVNLEMLPCFMAPGHSLLHEGQIPVEEDGRNEIACPEVAVNLCGL